MASSQHRTPVKQQIQTVSTQPSPKQLRTPQLDTPTTKHLSFFLTNPNSHPIATPISAIFLAQFDIHTGYELKWSKTRDDSISLKGVEFKSLPSGLHEVEREVISFVQPKSKGDDKDEDDLLYGVSVFHQNLVEQQNTSSRDNVKMYSLGILVDPILDKTSPLSRLSDNSWKPIEYTKGLEYVDLLDKLLSQWDDPDDFSSFETFFKEHSLTNSVEHILKSPSPQIRTFSNADQSDLVTNHHSHHYLLKLPQFLELAGPLIFPIWRSALLRERLLLFDAPSIEQNCAFAYCLSILSIIPQDIAALLSDSGSSIDTKNLKFLQPIYSVGVNDIDWLKSIELKNIEKGFIASSTDEILLFKDTLYDLSVKFRDRQNDIKIPTLVSSHFKKGANKTPQTKASQRDLKRFKIITKELNLYSNLNANELDHSFEVQWWSQVTEPISWKELAWSGFFWWASAGEKNPVEQEQDYENLLLIDEERGEIENALLIVGYFHSVTKRLFTAVSDIVNGENPQDTEDSDLVDTVVFSHSDIYEMGLDPYTDGDVEFVIKLIKKWWNREAKLSSNLANLCCF